MWRIEHPIVFTKVGHLEEMFTGEKPEVSHLRIFGCLVYVYIPKDKRSKLDPLGKKGIFVGYNETSKAYRVYIPGHKQIEISRDLTFDEDAALKNSKKCRTDEDHDKEPVAPRVANTRNDVVPKEHDIENHDMADPQRPTDPPRGKKRPAWACEIKQDAERYGAPEGTYRESKKPKPYSSYVALLSDIIDAEPTCYEEVAEKKE
jgi:hypothetical protein